MSNISSSVGLKGPPSNFLRELDELEYVGSGVSADEDEIETFLDKLRAQSKEEFETMKLCPTRNAKAAATTIFLKKVFKLHNSSKLFLLIVIC